MVPLGPLLPSSLPLTYHHGIVRGLGRKEKKQRRDFSLSLQYLGVLWPALGLRRETFFQSFSISTCSTSSSGFWLLLSPGRTILKGKKKKEKLPASVILHQVMVSFLNYACYHLLFRVVRELFYGFCPEFIIVFSGRMSQNRVYLLHLAWSQNILDRVIFVS